jgi:hypothetical protein
MPRFTYEDNWASAHSRIANSYYKTEYNTKISHAEQIITQLGRIVEDDDYALNPQAEILRKAFGYENFEDISELHIIKLTLNDKGILSLKIAAIHPNSEETCLVGTFSINHAMNIHSLDKLDIIERKIPRLILPKIKFALPTVIENLEEKENTSPNKSTTPVKNIPFWKQASASHSKLPVDDKLLALLSTATLAEDETDTSRRFHT